VPGSPLDPRAKGTNRLIREGATLTESADDVVSGLRSPARTHVREPDGASPRTARDRRCKEADRIRREIEELLGPSPVEIDELVRQCGAPVPVVLAVLLELELAGRLHRHSGNRGAWDNAEWPPSVMRLSRATPSPASGEGQKK
jgi:DNA processing protein